MFLCTQSDTVPTIMRLSKKNADPPQKQTLLTPNETTPYLLKRPTTTTTASADNPNVQKNLCNTRKNVA